MVVQAFVGFTAISDCGFRIAGQRWPEIRGWGVVVRGGTIRSKWESDSICDCGFRIAGKSTNLSSSHKNLLIANSASFARCICSCIAQRSAHPFARNPKSAIRNRQSSVTHLRCNDDLQSDLYPTVGVKRESQALRRVNWPAAIRTPMKISKVPLINSIFR